jgi:protein gp37
MNKQGILNKTTGQWSGGIEWTRVNGRPGFTWNVLQGCKHGCEWRMPDGTIAGCYANDVAKKFKTDKYFPNGFEQHYWNPERLSEPLNQKEPAGIFLDSMSDLMGNWVPREQIEAVFKICEQAPQHIFQLLTKNAPNLLKFKLPSNVWAGVSAPPTFMFGKELTPEQQRSMVRKQLGVLDELRLYSHPVCWMSIEPLSFDIAEVFDQWVADNGVDLPLQWAVVGAASNGPRKFQPNPEHTRKLHDVLRAHEVAIFHKGNLKWTPHLEEFPLTLPEAETASK